MFASAMDIIWDDFDGREENFECVSSCMQVCLIAVPVYFNCTAYRGLEKTA